MHAMLVDTETLQEKTGGKKALSLCDGCFRKPNSVVKTVGRATQTGQPGTRKRGSNYKETPFKDSKQLKANSKSAHTKSGDLTKHFPTKPDGTTLTKKEQVRPKTDKVHTTDIIPRLPSSPSVPQYKNCQ
jgi:hypothetical protein